MSLKGIKQTLEHIAKRVASCKKHPRKLLDLGKKLEKKIIIKKDGCWIWQGAIFKGNKYKGDYGQIRIGRRSSSKLLKAHKICYEYYIGPVPTGFELDHLCHNTLCVNPKHLEAVTHKVNCQRRKDSRLPYCKHGHKYTKETIYINTRGIRECKICKHSNSKRWKNLNS